MQFYLSKLFRNVDSLQFPKKKKRKKEKEEVVPSRKFMKGDK